MAKGVFSIQLNENDYAYVQRALSQMQTIEKNAIVKKGLEEGLSVVVRQGKINLANTLSTDPVNVRMRTGNLMKSFKIRVIKTKGKGYAGFTRKGNHSHLVDSGTEKRWTKRGAYRGSISKGIPKTGSQFWHNAFEQRKTQAANELMDSVRKSINNIIRRNS